MKRHLTCLALLPFFQWPSLAQGVTSQSAQDLSVRDEAQQIGPPGKGEFAITEAGAHHRRWEKVSAVADAEGQWQNVTNSYVELGTGLNRRDEQGRWVPAEASFELVNGAAVAQRTAHQVILTSPTDALPLDLLTPDGLRLSARVLGIAYYSATTGNSVMIAEPRPSEGQVSGSTVVYSDCFDGGFRASLRYRLSLAGLEQDLIFETQIGPPTEYGFDESEEVRLQLITEFLNAPEARVDTIAIRTETDSVKRERLAEPDLLDQHINFGLMAIGAGRAFSLELPGQTGPGVVKRFQVVDGRTVLFEEVLLSDAAAILTTLPERPQADAHRARQFDCPDRMEQMLATVPSLPPISSELLVCATDPTPRRGLVADFALLQSTTNLTLRSDTTYYLTNQVVCSGVTLVEGGTVVKAAPWDENNPAKLFISSGSLECKTGPFRPAVITARDDDTVGEILPASQHSPSGYYGSWLSAVVPVTLSNIHSRYGQFGTALWNSTNFVVTDCQFLNCNTAVEVAYGAAAFRNVLTYNSVCAFAIYYGSSLSGENLTVNIASWLNASGGSPPSQFSFTNSLVTQVTNTNSFAGANNAFLSSNSGVYRSVGAGAHYLSSDSAYRNVGTTNVHAQLLSQLRLKTTYPPVLLTNDIKVASTLAPTAQRDWDTPDLGYHYNPLDYCAGGINLTNATLVLTNGVVIGAYANCGITLKTGAQLVSEGTPERPNRLVRYDVVQEQPYAAWLNPGGADTAGTLKESGSSSQPFGLAWTEFSCLAGSYAHWIFGALQSSLQMKDCQVFGGTFLNKYGTGSGTFGVTNCLFHRVGSTFGNDSGTAVDIYGRNNLFRGGTLTLRAPSGSSWGWYDNAFDGVTVSQTATGIPNGYNGYVNATRLTPNAATDVVLTNFTYQSGPLGFFYHGQTNLANVGSRTASAAGLYHHTTTTNQTKEASTTVDLGFHYVALSGSSPNDADGDGRCDVLEDGNGDGSSSSGETNWQSSTDPGLKVIITEPKPNTNLP